MALFDDFSIELARKRGAPDPDGDAVRARQVTELSMQHRFEEAKAALDTILDPVWRGGLAQRIVLDRDCRCFVTAD